MVEHQQILQFQIERERIHLQIYIVQPILMTILYGYVMYSIFTGNLRIGGSLLISLSLLTGIYYHFNFIKPFNILYIKIENDTLHTKESYFNNKELELSKIDYLYIHTHKIMGITIRKKLKCYYKYQEITLINMYHPLFGIIPNSNLQEFLFHLHQIHSTIEIHSSANLLD